MNINHLLEKSIDELSNAEQRDIVAELRERLGIELARDDRSGIYARTQTDMAYNSNRIEGSTLTPDQTASLFYTGTVRASAEEVYRAKDIEEMTGHFAMFNHMLRTFKEPLSEELIKSYHYRLKAGVFEDVANGYPIGEYKSRQNMVADIDTVRPDEVSERMRELIASYERGDEITLSELAAFHAEFEHIHPFQDGNGRVGRMLLFKECLRQGIVPVIIRDSDKAEYYMALNRAQKIGDTDELCAFFRKEQQTYLEELRKFLWVYG